MQEKSRCCSGYKKCELTKWSKEDEVQIIEAAGNYEIKVDKWYYEKNCLFNWKVNGYGYAYRKDENGKASWMARDVLGVESSNFQVDHINGNTIDNRESNLRICTAAENSYNKRKVEGCSSNFKGVIKRGVNWYAKISKDGKATNLGIYDNEITAALVYDSAAVYLFGEFANINFPQHKDKLLTELKLL